MFKDLMLKQTIKDLLLITLGCCIYGFGLVTINIENQLAEGGLTGITLILRYWFQLDPAYATILLNIPLLLLGYKYLGKRALAYTIFGTGMMSFWLFVWQRIPVSLNLNHDLVIASLLAGLFAGFGSGIVYRVGATTGGTDVLARIIEKFWGVAMGKSLLIFDIIVLLLSLSYIDLEHMMYTLIASYVFSKAVTFTQEGAYSARGLLIISQHSNQIAEHIMIHFERGVSFLEVQGAYSKQKQTMIYCVVSQSEVSALKRLIDQIDPTAFVSIIDVHEALGEGFTYGRPLRKQTFWRRKKTA